MEPEQLGDMRVAVVQRPPVLLDGAATLAAAVDHLHAAADGGARLVVFPEAYVPGYPVWIWRLRPEADFRLTSEIHRELLANSVDLVADGLRPLRDAAAKRGVVVVCGVHERDGTFSRATLYNTLVTIGADGAIVNRHRKMMPTNPERMVWGRGDASSRASGRSCSSCTYRDAVTHDRDPDSAAATPAQGQPPRLAGRQLHRGTAPHSQPGHLQRSHAVPTSPIGTRPTRSCADCPNARRGITTSWAVRPQILGCSRTDRA